MLTSQQWSSVLTSEDEQDPEVGVREGRGKEEWRGGRIRGEEGPE